MNQVSQKSFFTSETLAAQSQIDGRKRMLDLFLNNNIPPEEIIVNLGLFTRSSLLAKYITLHEIYQRIKAIPGCIMEFGIWYGQNLVLLENLRAIHEPFNKDRKIIGFDTFEGYRNFSKFDKKSDIFSEQSYAVGNEYKEFLENLLQSHEQSNILGNVNQCHELIKGSVVDTVPQYFIAHPETIVAFCYFDLGLYEPTKAVLQSIKKHLIPGSIILFDELTWPKAPGEAIAFKEEFKDVKYTIERCPYFASKNIVTIREI